MPQVMLSHLKGEDILHEASITCWVVYFNTLSTSPQHQSDCLQKLLTQSKLRLFLTDITCQFFMEVADKQNPSTIEY